MFCANCGNEIADDVKFCPICGAQTSEKAPEPVEAEVVNDTTQQNYNQNTYQQAGYQQNAYQQNTYQQTGYSQMPNGKMRQEPYLAGQDKVVMALLAFFLGGLGIHCFVMGETRKGIIRIVFSCLCGIGAIFALIDFIMILTDSYVVNPEAYFFN